MTAPPPLALYVHLPWCEKKCPYCDFNSHEAKELPEAAYIDTLLRDLDGELATDPLLQRREITSVFIGGGTPSLFSPDAIDRFMRGLCERLQLASQIEITMEANPGSTERLRLQGFAEAGITRFSLGIQSLQNESLKALGRLHDRDDAQRAIEAARDSGVSSFNLDLMHGLPGQSAAQGLADLEGVIATGAPHLSWYQLTIEPNTRFYRFPPTLPDEDTLGTLETQGGKLLQASGYRRYEVSAWAKPGEECRHNLNYWRFGDYLGIGAGAHGKVTQADRRVLRYRKTRRPEDYLGLTGTARREPRYLDKPDLIGEFMLGALRLSDGFETSLFESRTGLREADIRPTVQRLCEDELLEQDDTHLRPSALGRQFLDDVVGRFFETESLIARDA